MKSLGHLTGNIFGSVKRFWQKSIAALGYHGGSQRSSDAWCLDQTQIISDLEYTVIQSMGASFQWQCRFD